MSKNDLLTAELIRQFEALAQGYSFTKEATVKMSARLSRMAEEAIEQHPMPDFATAQSLAKRFIAEATELELGLSAPEITGISNDMLHWYAVNSLIDLPDETPAALQAEIIEQRVEAFDHVDDEMLEQIHALKSFRADTTEKKEETAPPPDTPEDPDLLEVAGSPAEKLRAELADLTRRASEGRYVDVDAEYAALMAKYENHYGDAADQQVIEPDTGENP